MSRGTASPGGAGVGRRGRASGMRSRAGGRAPCAAVRPAPGAGDPGWWGALAWTHLAQASASQGSPELSPEGPGHSGWRGTPPRGTLCPRPGVRGRSGHSTEGACGVETSWWTPGLSSTWPTNGAGPARPERSPLPLDPAAPELHSEAPAGTSDRSSVTLTILLKTKAAQRPAWCQRGTLDSQTLHAPGQQNRPAVTAGVWKEEDRSEGITGQELRSAHIQHVSTLGVCT